MAAGGTCPNHEVPSSLFFAFYVEKKTIFWLTHLNSLQEAKRQKPEGKVRAFRDFPGPMGQGLGWIMLLLPFERC